ncbi:MAG: hypothetical protein ACREVJ_02335, partial [Gammaproteobacteria bacterium]
MSFCGQYRSASRRPIRGRTAPAITFGFSKAHRPDLKQLLFILTVDADGRRAGSRPLRGLGRNDGAVLG